VNAGNNNVGGSGNTFVGRETNFNFLNQSGNANTLLGTNAKIGADNLSNATAIGSRAQVTKNNSLVLGSINGVNSAVADTNVGIGTTAPRTKLHLTNGKIYVEANGQALS
jgi:trimeric autotransporter adhesin